MADRATQIVNFYETTLASLLPSGSTNATLTDTPGINATLGNEDTWFYLVIDPDSSGSREVIVVKASSGTSLTTIERDLETDHSGTGPDHQSGTTVRMAVLAQHIDDQNDRITTAEASLSTAIQTSEVGNGLIWTGSVLNVDINGATDGTGITVDGDTDLVLLYDADGTAVKKVFTSQIATPVSLNTAKLFFAANG